MHYASHNGHTSTCQLLCALDGVDQNAVNDDGKTALDMAIFRSHDSVRALLEFNVDTSKVRVVGRMNVEIAQLLEEHRKRSVKEILSLIERILKFYVVFRKPNELQFEIECSKSNE